MSPTTPPPAGLLGDLSALVKRHGLVTVLAGALLFDAFVTRRDERAERRELLTAIRDNLKDEVAAVRELAVAEAGHADAVRLAWPRVNLPRSLPPPPSSPRVARSTSSTIDEATP